jgi:hypothetical protein
VREVLGTRLRLSRTAHGACATLLLCLAVATASCRGRAPVQGRAPTSMDTHAPDQESIVGRYGRPHGTSHLALHAQLKSDHSFIASENYLFMPGPEPVGFYGTWRRDGELVRLWLRRKAVGFGDRPISDEVIDRHVVGHLIFHEDGQVRGLKFPHPDPLHPGMAELLVR